MLTIIQRVYDSQAGDHRLVAISMQGQPATRTPHIPRILSLPCNKQQGSSQHAHGYAESIENNTKMP
jgi:hypothetical protein